MPSAKALLINAIKVCFFSVFIITSVYGQNKFNKLTNNLNTVFIQDSLPGLSVILVSAKGIIYNHNFGYADIENKKPYTTSTIQNIGSVSKTFIAVALMKAIELHYFTLETDINDILPFKVINPNNPGDKITIRELTNHTSGIIDNDSIYPNSYKFYPGLRPYSPDAFNALRAIGYRQKITDTTLAQFFYNYLSEKGTHYSTANFGHGKAGATSSYSNIASALAAYLIEIKSGVSYDEFTRRYILGPLNMTHSGWFLTSINLKDHAKLYYNADMYFPLYNLLTYPDGGLKTSANDLSKYLISMIKGYQKNPTLLDTSAYRIMFTPQFSVTSPPKNINLTRRNKGIFWNIYTNGTIGHDGDDPGVSTFLFFNTKTGIGGLFLCNKYMPNKQPVIDLLVNATNSPD